MVLLSYYLPYIQINPTYWDKTYKLVEPALEYSPNRLEPYFALAQLYVLKQEPEKAVEYLNKALEITDKRDDVYQNLLNVYSRTDQEKFKEVAGEYIFKFELGYNQWHQLAMFYFQAGMPAEAESILVEKVISQNPNDPQGYISLASVYKAANAYEPAIKVLQEAGNRIPAFKSEADELINILETEQASSTADTNTEDK